MNETCKRDGCTEKAENRARYGGYCSLTCRDYDEYEQEIQSLKKELEAARGTIELINKHAREQTLYWKEKSEKAESELEAIIKLKDEYYLEADEYLERAEKAESEKAVLVEAIRMLTKAINEEAGMPFALQVAHEAIQKVGGNKTPGDVSANKEQDNE